MLGYRTSARGGRFFGNRVGFDVDGGSGWRSDKLNSARAGAVARRLAQDFLWGWHETRASSRSLVKKAGTVTIPQPGDAIDRGAALARRISRQPSGRKVVV